MAETYCGKSCAECAQKETMNCPGCKAGPGRQFGGECELAQCVRKKSHETCDTCSLRGNCGTLRGRDSMPEQRRRRQQAEAEWKAAIARRAPILGKWLWILFLLVIPSTIAGVMTLDVVADMAPGVYMAGEFLSAVVMLAYGGILLLLASQESGYRTAGICSLIASAVRILATVISGGSETQPWTLMLSIPALIVSVVGEYNEYMAHSAVLSGVDNEQAEKWEKLWKWYIGLYAAMFGSILLMVLIPLLGALALMGASIGLVVISISKLVYLYRTARVFREYPAA